MYIGDHVNVETTSFNNTVTEGVSISSEVDFCCHP